MKCKIKVGAILSVLVALELLWSVWGPEWMTGYSDRELLDRIHVQPAEEAGEGYRYTLNANEKLYILSQCLNHQMIAASEQSRLTGNGPEDAEYQDFEGSYAFVVNHKGPSGREITDEQIYEICNKELEVLKEAEILPRTVKEVEQVSYDAVLYSAIDVPEPRNNVAVWKVSLSDSQKNADKENRLIDAYIDADSGKIYEFYVRTSLQWEEIDTDAVAERWSSYMGLSAPEVYESDNPLLETTPYFKKYVFPGIGDERTVVTVGFYEGINELFLKISK